MRVPVRQRGMGLQFNITPLIDIVFLLVIFFLVATHFVSSEVREELDLPLASQTDDRPQPPRRLIINVRRDGTFSVSGREVGLAEIEQMIAEDAAGGLGDYEVQIRSDRQAVYEFVEPILLACARHGVTRVGFAKRDR